MTQQTLSRAVKLFGTDVPDGKKRTLTGILFRTGNSVFLRGQLTGATMNPVFEVIP